MNFGIIGAGFVGRAVTRLAVARGLDVMISNSRDPRTLASAMIALCCRVGSPLEAAAFGEIVLLAVPFNNVWDLSPESLRDKVVLDATNYYRERDGDMPELNDRLTTTSEMVARRLKGARVVKVFNAISERDIESDAQTSGAANRRALPMASDDEAAKSIASNLINQLGFDVVDAGALSEGWRFERARPAFGERMNVNELRGALAAAGPGRAHRP